MGFSWRQDPAFDSTTGYRIDERAGGLEASTISFFFWLRFAFSPRRSRPANCREASSSSLAHHPALTNGLQFPATSTTSGMEGAEFGGDQRHKLAGQIFGTNLRLVISVLVPFRKDRRNEQLRSSGHTRGLIICFCILHFEFLEIGPKTRTLAKNRRKMGPSNLVFI